MQQAVLILVTVVATVQAIDKWNYSDPETWKEVEEWSCNGIRQSPININTSRLKEHPRLLNFVLTNFDRRLEGNLTNTGHTVAFFPSGDANTATFSNHIGTYSLEQFHFHWGANDKELGSEHTIDGEKFSGELHFVTRKNTGSITDGDAYAVLGVFLMEDSTVTYTNTIWMEFLDKIPQMANESETVSRVRLDDMIPNDRSYYYYQGSLSTPPCSEVVQWFLLKNPIRVPSTFMTALRTMIDDAEEEALTLNFRDVQSVNNRDIMVHNTPLDTAGATLRLTSFGIGFLLTIALLVHAIY